MARDYANLSHHESLRFDYLQKNFHYLNQSEQKELAYLQAKQAGRLTTPDYSEHQFRQGSTNQTPEGLPKMKASRSERQRQAELRLKSGQDTFSQAEQFGAERTPEGLPQFKVSTSRTSRRRQDKSKGIASNPKSKLPKKKLIKRILLSVLGLLLSVLAVMIFLFFKSYNAARSNEETAKAAEVEVFNGQKTEDGINILVLGTDGRIGQESEETRTDTIMVVNIGNSSNDIKIVSFMRDTLINIPGYSYDDGMGTVYYDQKLNAAFSYGEQDKKQGAEAVRVALKNHFDLDIQYYAMVDFATFASAVDTLFPDGVKIDASFSTVNGEAVDSVEVPDDLNAENGVVPNQTIEVGEQFMDGRTLLNYARFRKDDEGDSGRVRRQQQVLAAILQQVKDPVKLFTGSEALGKVMGMTSTNMSFPFILRQGVSVIGDASNGIEQVTIPEMGDWVDDYDAFGGMALYIDFEKYQQVLAEMKMR